MEIIIKITEDQLASINKKTPTEQFVSELTAYADGLVAFYISEGDKIVDEEVKVLDVKRLEVLKTDEGLLATVDDRIRLRVVSVEPVEIVERVEVRR